MKYLILGALLIAGTVAGYQSYLIAHTSVNAQSNDSKETIINLDRRILLAGNVPCNPAKQVCED